MTESQPHGGRLPRRDLRYALFLGAALALSVVGSVLAIGAVHVPVLLAVAVPVSVAAFAALRRRRTAWPLPAWVLAGLAAYCVLQAIPLPAGLLAAIAPKNADAWARVLEPFGEPSPTWAPISLDPGASLVEGLKWWLYALAFAAAAALATKVGATPGVGIVFGSALIAALTTVGHGLVGAQRVFGLYRPTFQPSAWHLGPLLDPNNLSGYLNLGALSGLGLILSHRVPVPRWLIGLAVAVVVAVNVTTGSRAGFLALFVGVLALGLVLLRVRRRVVNERWDRATAARWMVLATLGGGVVLAFLGASSTAWSELAQTDVDKLRLQAFVVPLVRDHFWFGVGRGAFESAFASYHVPKLNLLFTHAECFPSDWAAGWGVPVTVVAGGAFAWACRPSALRIAYAPISAAGWAALVALAVQNLGDLGLEIPAVALAAAVLLGSLWGQAAHDRARVSGSARRELPRRWRGPVAVLVTLGAVATVLRWGLHSSSRDRSRMYARWAGGAKTPAEVEAFRGELRSAMLRHPVEPYFTYLGAVAAFRARDQNALTWISRTLELDGGRGRTHFLAAEVLAARKAIPQALLELRLAVTSDMNFASLAAERAVQWSADCERLAEAVPAGPSGSPMLSGMGSALFAKGVEPCAERLLREAVARAPQAPEPRVELARLLLSQLRRAAPGSTCTADGREACLAEASRLANEVAGLSPRRSDSLRLRAEIALVRGNAEQACALLTDGCGQVDDRAPCLEARLNAAAATRRLEALIAAAKDYLSVTCTAAEACSTANLRVGDLFSAQGDLATARTHYERAAREAHTEEAWLRVADAASRAGAHRQAADALAKVAKLRGGGDAALKARIETEQRAALGGP